MPMSTLIRRRTRYAWYLATSDFYEDGEAAIDWREILPLDGTPAERSALLKSLKELVVALIEYPVTKGRARLAHSTVLLWCRQLRYLVRWMATQDIWSFDKLRPDHLLKFLMTRRERHGQGAPSDATWHAYILLYRRMWELRGKYSLPLSVNPGLIEADAKLLRGRAARPFKAVPEEVALPLINDAIEWLQRMGPFMARAAEELWQEKRLVGDELPALLLDQRLQSFFCRGKEHRCGPAGTLRLRDEAQRQIATIIDIRLLGLLCRSVQSLVCPRPLREEARLRHIVRVAALVQHARDAGAQAISDIVAGAGDPCTLFR